MFFSRTQTKARAAERAVHAERVKDLARAAFGLGPADAISANEIACPDPGCPDMETVILLMRAGRPTEAVKIAKPLSAVVASDFAPGRPAL